MSTRTEWVNGSTDGLPEGPWKDEPDKVHWIDPTSDLDCLIVRGPVGALCGYVAVPPGHPWHGKGYSQCLHKTCDDEYCWSEHSPDGTVEVHGGLTFASGCRESDEGEAHGICHVPAPGRPGDVWWFGFDCSHSFDLAPRMLDYGSDFGGVYRDIAYVSAQVTELAQQLAAVTA